MDYKGILVTDGLAQYHLVDKKAAGCDECELLVHARRDYAMPSRRRTKRSVSRRRSVAYQALSRIALIYKLEKALKYLTPKERTQEWQTTTKLLVEEYFA